MANDAIDYKYLCNSHFLYIPDMELFNPVVIRKIPPETTRIFSIVVSLITNKVSTQTTKDSKVTPIPSSAKTGLFNSNDVIPSDYLYQIVNDDGTSSADPNDPFKGKTFKAAAKLEGTTITTIISYMKKMLVYKNITVSTTEKTDSSGTTYHHYSAKWNYKDVE